MSFFRSKLPNLVCLLQPRAERPLQAPELRRHLRRDRRHLGGLGPVRRLPAPGVGQIRLRGDAGEVKDFFLVLLCRFFFPVSRKLGTIRVTFKKSFECGRDFVFAQGIASNLLNSLQNALVSLAKYFSFV